MPLLPLAKWRMNMLTTIEEAIGIGFTAAHFTYLPFPNDLQFSFILELYQHNWISQDQLASDNCAMFRNLVEWKSSQAILGYMDYELMKVNGCVIVKLPLPSGDYFLANDAAVLQKIVSKPDQEHSLSVLKALQRRFKWSKDQRRYDLLFKAAAVANRFKIMKAFCNKRKIDGFRSYQLIPQQPISQGCMLTICDCVKYSTSFFLNLTQLVDKSGLKVGYWPSQWDAATLEILLKQAFEHKRGNCLFLWLLLCCSKTDRELGKRLYQTTTNGNKSTCYLDYTFEVERYFGLMSPKKLFKEVARRGFRPQCASRITELQHFLEQLQAAQQGNDALLASDLHALYQQEFAA